MCKRIYIPKIERTPSNTRSGGQDRCSLQNAVYESRGSKIYPKHTIIFSLIISLIKSMIIFINWCTTTLKKYSGIVEMVVVSPQDELILFMGESTVVTVLYMFPQQFSQFTHALRWSRCIRSTTTTSGTATLSGVCLINHDQVDEERGSKKCILTFYNCFFYILQLRK